MYSEYKPLLSGINTQGSFPRLHGSFNLFWVAIPFYIPSHPQYMSNPGFTSFSLVSGVICILCFHHSTRCMEISHCCFNVVSHEASVKLIPRAIIKRPTKINHSNKSTIAASWGVRAIGTQVWGQACVQSKLLYKGKSNSIANIQTYIHYI